MKPTLHQMKVDLQPAKLTGFIHIVEMNLLDVEYYDQLLVFSILFQSIVHAPRSQNYLGLCGSCLI